MENNPPNNLESPVPTGDDIPTEASQSSQTHHPAQHQGHYDQQAQFPARYPLYYTMRPPKDRSIALILEILPGLFGFLGFGWIYSGNTAAGIAILIGFLLWDAIAIIITLVAGGFACICTVPISLAFIAVSASILNSYTKRNPQLFGP